MLFNTLDAQSAKYGPQEILQEKQPSFFNQQTTGRKEETCKLTVAYAIFPQLAMCRSYLDPGSKKQTAFLKYYIYETIEIHFKY